MNFTLPSYHLNERTFRLFLIVLLALAFVIYLYAMLARGQQPIPIDDFMPNSLIGASSLVSDTALG
tara:strand:- start:306 stop:503 length:198 start_codon:yes stop_codon:yes gene_type:complete